MPSILTLNAAYRAGGTTDQLVDVMAQALRARGAEVSVVALRERQIHFCHNCRVCMQAPGPAPGHCVQHDDMQALVQAIERSDGYILASPTNLGSATALFKQFMERLAVYGHWPWGAHAPVERKAALRTKRAVVVSSGAAPGWVGRWVWSTDRQLQQAARLMGARTVARLSAGPLAQALPFEIDPALRQRAERAALRLLA